MNYYKLEVFQSPVFLKKHANAYLALIRSENNGVYSSNCWNYFITHFNY